MIRVTCPGCQRVHDFLELYIGLTIVCKHCRHGILVPAASEEGLPPPEAAAAMESAGTIPLAPLPPSDESMNGALVPSDGRPVVKKPREKPLTQEDRPGDAPSRKRMLILAGVLVVILAGGAFLVARSLWPKGDGTGVPVAIDPSKKDDRSGDKGKDAAGADKDQKKKPKSDEPDVILVDWYAAKELPGAGPDKKVQLTTADRERGCVFVVARVKLSSAACARGDDKKGWTIKIAGNDFALLDDFDREYGAVGLEFKGTFGSADAKVYKAETSVIVQAKEAPRYFEQSVFFTTTQKALDLSEMRLRYQDFSTVTLTDAKRRKK